MTFDFGVLFVGLIFSGVGFVYFSFGKKQAKFKVTLCGLVLMVYPYFTNGMPLTVFVGALLSALPFLFHWW